MKENNYVGIVRRIDDLGRISIPKEYRNQNGFEDNQALEILSNENGEIIIKKHIPDEVLKDTIQLLKEIQENQTFNLTAGEEKEELLQKAIEYLKR